MHFLRLYLSKFLSVTLMLSPRPYVFVSPNLNMFIQYLFGFFFLFSCNASGFPCSGAKSACLWSSACCRISCITSGTQWLGEKRLCIVCASACGVLWCLKQYVGVNLNWFSRAIRLKPRRTLLHSNSKHFCRWTLSRQHTEAVSVTHRQLKYYEQL